MAKAKRDVVLFEDTQHSHIVFDTHARMYYNRQTDMYLSREDEICLPMHLSPYRDEHNSRTIHVHENEILEVVLPSGAMISIVCTKDSTEVRHLQMGSTILNEVYCEDMNWVQTIPEVSFTD